MDDRVIPDIMDVLGKPKESYPENDILISFFLQMCQEGAVLYGISRKTLRDPDSRLGWEVHN